MKITLAITLESQVTVDGNVLPVVTKRELPVGAVDNSIDLSRVFLSMMSVHVMPFITDAFTAANQQVNDVVANYNEAKAKKAAEEKAKKEAEIAKAKAAKQQQVKEVKPVTPPPVTQTKESTNDGRRSENAPLSQLPADGASNKV